MICITSIDLNCEIKRIKFEGAQSVRTGSGAPDDRRVGKLGGSFSARFSYGPGIMRDALLSVLHNYYEMDFQIGLIATFCTPFTGAEVPITFHWVAVCCST